MDPPDMPYRSPIPIGLGHSGRRQIQAYMAASLLDLNSAPLEQLDGELVPAEGEAAADEEGDASIEAAGVHLATCFFLDINSTPELVDEIIPGDEAVGDEKIDAMAQDEAGIVPAQDEEANAPSEAAEELVDEIVPGGGEAVDNDETCAMVQDEEANVTAEAAGLQQSQPRLRKWLTDSQRHAAYIALQAKSRNGKLPKTATKEVAACFQTQIRVIQKIWRTAREQVALGLEDDDIADAVKSRAGKISNKWRNRQQTCMATCHRVMTRQAGNIYTVLVCICIESSTTLTTSDIAVFLTLAAISRKKSAPNGK
ncbi:hypothetical protein C2845_PM11G20070 [Panicum miliaceum]|uniref:DUF7769 domain-containing protein n=1 Tax=Panicum miliaceum TaxID=4540 RepID=A0A3L6RR50_PANMI|nr:hypothetical protein C2845_PM11G20070 [Panicum miliaceum]